MIQSMVGAGMFRYPWDGVRILRKSLDPFTDGVNAVTIAMTQDTLDAQSYIAGSQ
jgi:hypothetical protein